MLLDKFEKFLSFLKDKKIVITSHELVDLDGLSSCYALEYFLNTFFKTQQKAICFSEISKFTKNFILNYSERFPDINFSFQSIVDFSKYDVCLILDTNNIDQIKFKNEIKSSKIPFLFIDHHYKQNVIMEGNIPPLNLLFEDYSSTTEIILQFFKLFNVSLSLPLKVLMTAAILTDSGFFNYGDNQTLRNVSKLLDDELNFQDIRRLLKNHEDLSEKIAKIKGMQRVQLYREGDYLIGITNVSSYGARVASMLLQVGFDIGIVNSKEKETIRINTRAKKDVCLKTGLHLGKILDKIAGDYEGSGGGHDGAASLTCNVETRIIINEILVNVKPYLQSKF